MNLGEAYDGQIKIVQINIDDPASRAAVQRHQVRGTPTLVLIDAEGQIRDQVPGWPGYDTLTGAFDALLSEG